MPVNFTFTYHWNCVSAKILGNSSDFGLSGDDMSVIITTTIDIVKRLSVIGEAENSFEVNVKST